MFGAKSGGVGGAEFKLPGWEERRKRRGIKLAPRIPPPPLIHIAAGLESSQETDV